MKQKICILFSAIIVATSFVACTSSDDENSSMLTPTPTIEPSQSPDIDDEMSETSKMEYDIDDYVNSVKDVYDDDYLPDTVLDNAEINSRFGLTDDMYEEVYAEGSTLKTTPDVLIAVKSKPNMASEVKEKLEEYKESLISDTNFKESIDKIKASKIYTNGDYVFMMLLGANEFDDDMTDGFTNEIQKGMDALEDMFR